MAVINLNKAIRGFPKGHLFSEMLDRLGEETVTDEEVERILDPVLKMILEGRFESTHTYKV